MTDSDKSREAIKPSETTTPSVEGDRLEAIARIIDPSSWRVLDGYLADVKRLKNAGYDPDNFKDKASLAKARQIAALPCKGGEAEPFGVSGALNEVEALAVALFAHRCPGLIMYDDDVPYYEDAARAAFRTLDEPATPTTEPDTGRGLREALEEVRDLLMERIHGNPARSAAHNARLKVEGLLAALSDTPRGREEEGKQGLMASRDLKPTTVASSLKGSDVGEVKP